MEYAQFWWLRVACRHVPFIRQWKPWRQWCKGKWGRCSRLMLPGRTWIPLPYRTFSHDESW